MKIGLGIGIPFIRNYISSIVFDPSKLFTDSTNGAWYDPSDLTTLYRDAAGTLPVTAVEQPVGLMKDKSGRNNHAFNSSGNSANFPVLSARYNLLTKSEDFGDAVWAKGASVVVSPTKVTAPDGTQTATVISSNSSDISANRVSQFPSTGTGNHVAVLWMRSNTAQVVRLKLYGSSGGVVVATLDVSVSEVWTQFNISGTISTANAGISVGPNGISALVNVELWGADLRVANDGVNLPAYQRVNTATDYDSSALWPRYLRFNGTNQWLQTNSIDFTSTDKMFVSAGVRKLSDASIAILCELSGNASTANGALGLAAPWTSVSYLTISRGTSNAQATIAGYSAPITNVLSGIGDISGDQAILRINGSQAAISTANQGTGNFGNYPLYIGARGGSSLWFNGRLYGMVVAGKLANAVEITETEKYVNSKTAAY